jgi:hypothetical protein
MTVTVTGTGRADPDLPQLIGQIAGCIVERLAIDDSVTLFLRAADRALQLRFDTAASLQGADAQLAPHRITPDTDPGSVAPLLGWLHRRVEQVDLAADGALELRGRPGVLTIWPDEHQMSWTLRGSTGERVSCVADGKVIWG